MSAMSDERLSYLARKVFDRLYDEDWVDFQDEDAGLRLIKRAMEKWLQQENDIDKIVVQKIASLKRSIPPHSPEWEVLYEKYASEERSRRGS
jgi:hypothetical protein